VHESSPVGCAKCNGTPAPYGRAAACFDGMRPRVEDHHTGFCFRLLHNQRERCRVTRRSCRTRGHRNRHQHHNRRRGQWHPVPTQFPPPDKYSRAKHRQNGGHDHRQVLPGPIIAICGTAKMERRAKPVVVVAVVVIVTVAVAADVPFTAPSRRVLISVKFRFFMVRSYATD
jgi:hypothetical protein